MEVNNICFSCAGELQDVDAIVCNGFCKSSFHLKCVNQSIATRDIIRNSSQIFWMCKGCTRMMSIVNFRHTIASTNTVLQLINEKHNEEMQELRKEIKQNTDKINSLSQQNHTFDAQSQNTENQIDAPLTTRKRRRLQEGEDYVTNNDTPAVNNNEGTKEIDTDIAVPLAVPLREKKFVLYLSGFAPQATVNEISELVKKNLNTNDTVDVAKLVPKGKNLCELSFVSFKVGIGLHLKECALQSSSWQKGIVFREFLDTRQSSAKTTSTKYNFRTNINEQ